MRKRVHILDDNEDPDGLLICGKQAGRVMNAEPQKKDRVCVKCVRGLLARSNSYADVIGTLTDLLDMFERALDALTPPIQHHFEGCEDREESESVNVNEIDYPNTTCPTCIARLGYTAAEWDSMKSRLVSRPVQ